MISLFKSKNSEKTGLFARLKQGLHRTTNQLGRLFSKKIDQAWLDEVEERLLMADVGVESTEIILSALRAHIARGDTSDYDKIMATLNEQMYQILKPSEQPFTFSDAKPFVILVLGVNGVGKTTTIAKLAQRFKNEGKTVMLAAGDTFRAAAIEQLQAWGEDQSIPVIAQQDGADSAAVIFDAINAAKARHIDVLIADTAGRLHTKDHLMEELKKVVRVMKKALPDAPHEALLVLDATQGQNTLQQAQVFHKAIPLSGIALTKLDGTAKGGIIFAIAHQLKLPFRFIGIGEKASDLYDFNARDFVNALLAEEDETAS